MKCGWTAIFVAVLVVGLPWVGATTIYDVQYNETNNELQTGVAGGVLTELPSSPKVVVEAEGLQVVPIANIQDSSSYYDGRIVTIRGVMTIGVGVLDDQYTRAYVQDESGRGINVFDFDIVSELVRGSLVEVTGEIDDYLAAGASYPITEIKDVTVTVVQTGQPLPNPVFLTTAAASDPEWDGTWIEVSGVMVEDPYYAGGGYNVNLDDGSGQITVRIWDTTGIDVSEFAQGDTITAIGAGSIYMTTFQILTGYQEDIWEGPPDITGPPAISNTTHDPTSPLFTETVTVTSQVTDDGTVSLVMLFFSTDGGSSFDSTAMLDDGIAPDQTAGDEVYTGQIGPQSEGTVDYYLRAIDDEALVSTDPGNAPTTTYSYTVRSGLPGDGTGTATISPDRVDLSQAVAETLTVLGSPGLQVILATVEVVVPEGWSWSQSVSDVSLNGTGFSGASAGVADDTITITGASVDENNLGQLAIASLTSPGSAITSTFLVKTAEEGGVLAAIDSSPQVVVGAVGPEITPIANIQDSSSYYEGKIVTIRAVVTIGASVLDEQYTRAYVQDESGRGINLFNFDIIPAISRGNLVEVTGTIEDYLASGAIDATTEITDVSVTALDTGQALPDPIILSTGGAQSGEWDGTWIQVTGVMQEDPYFAGGGYNLNIDDGSGRYTVRIWETTGIDVSGFAEGDTITAIGVGSVYSTSYQMLTGYQEDIFEGQPQVEGIGYASIEPATVKATDTDLTMAITIWSDVDCGLTEISVEIPQSWTWTQPETSNVLLSGEGFPEGSTVEVSGDRMVLIHGAAVCEPGIVSISHLDAPEIAEISTFRIKTAMEGESLKEISNSPQVTVKGLEKAVLNVEPRVFVPNRQVYSADDGFPIQFNVPSNSRVVLRLFDIEGRLVRTLVDEEQYAGPGQVVWNGRDELREVVPMGVYICHLEATDRQGGETTTDQAPIVVGTPLD
jgi:hypothetical protein